MKLISLYWICSPLSIYQQQVWGLSRLHKNECTCQAVITDLFCEITKWHEDGDTIILLMDFNKDVLELPATGTHNLQSSPY